jgi:MinD superfamily P-loop ATPase
MSGEFTARGYHPPKKRQGAECKGCRICELMCPDFAIFIEELKGEALETKGPAGKQLKEIAGRMGKGRKTTGPGRKGGKR